MDKKRAKKAIYKLRRKRQLLETYLLNTGSQMPVWLSLQYTYCKKGNCKCTQGRPHGPFYYLFFKEKGKIFHRYLPEGKVGELRPVCLAYKTYNERLAQLNRLNKKIDKILRAYQKENFIPIPQWLKKKKARKKTR
jgi:hypothetical protein